MVSSEKNGIRFGFQDEREYAITTGESVYKDAATRPVKTLKKTLPTLYINQTVATPKIATITAGPAGL